MLLSVHVKNIALIDELEIDLSDGLNVLTGETGAGKSIIIDAVNFALGKRMPRDIVRDDAEYALSELIFSVDSDAVRDSIREFEIPVENDELIIQRKILNGRSSCRVNGESVTQNMLKDLSSLLIDIHGQHEHQSLLDKKNHIRILDKYLPESFGAMASEIDDRYRRYTKKSRELKEALERGKDAGHEAELARFEADEINNAALIEHEDEELEAAYTKMLNSRKIIDAVTNAHSLTGYDTEEGAGGSIGRAVSALRSVSSYDEGLDPIVAQLTDIDSLLNDFNRSIADYRDSLDFGEDVFASTEERLNLINHLKAKYGSTIGDVIRYGKEREDDVEKFNDYDSYVAGLESELSGLWTELLKLCRQASEIRSREALNLKGDIMDALRDLNFPDARFDVLIESGEEYISGRGFDNVEFMISLNPGEKLKSLSDVASGGELSRIMLALKSVFADKDEIPTLIFDEIDTGISGRTAQKVSEKMAFIARDHQVLCVTHLPQIAAMADTHFEISKTVTGGRTITGVRTLDEENSVKELARMLGGVKITDTVMMNAKEMKDMALSTKQSCLMQRGI